MTAKFTPGPWKKTKMDSHTAISASTLIARVYSTTYGDSENEHANARLIAAAPELVTALRPIADLQKWRHSPEMLQNPSVATTIRHAIDTAAALLARIDGE